jgi:hypothetical protein
LKITLWEFEVTATIEGEKETNHTSSVLDLQIDPSQRCDVTLSSIAQKFNVSKEQMDKYGLFAPILDKQVLSKYKQETKVK